MKQILRKAIAVAIVAATLTCGTLARPSPRPVRVAMASSVEIIPYERVPVISVTERNQRLLAAHNRERAAMGVPLLTWSDALAASAEKWAAHLAETRTFDHAPVNPGPDDQGENLWMGSIGAYTPEVMVGDWIQEKSLFKKGRFPQVSTTGNWSDVGHYTQLIWRKTTAVGCAVRANQSDEYLVCRYGPPGNWMGADPLEAIAPADGQPPK